MYFNYDIENEWTRAVTTKLPPRKSKLRPSNTRSTLKQVSIPSFQENLVPKMKYIPNAMKFGNQSRSSLLIINMIFEIADLDPKLKTWEDLVSKLQCAQFL